MNVRRTLAAIALGGTALGAWQGTAAADLPTAGPESILTTTYDNAPGHGPSVATYCGEALNTITVRMAPWNGVAQNLQVWSGDHMVTDIDSNVINVNGSDVTVSIDIDQRPDHLIYAGTVELGIDAERCRTAASSTVVTMTTEAPRVTELVAPTTTAPAPTTVMAPITTVGTAAPITAAPRCTEDMACWDCASMGNHVCVPTLPATGRSSRALAALGALLVTVGWLLVRAGRANNGRNHLGR